MANRNTPTLLNDRTLAFLIRAAATVIILAGIHYSQPVLAPLVVSALLTFVLTPLANYVERRVRIRSLTIAIVVFIVAGSASVASWFVVTQISTLQAQWPLYSQNLRGRAESVYSEIQHLKEQAVSLGRFGNRDVQKGSHLSGLPSVLKSGNNTPPVPPDAPVPIPGFEQVSSLLASLLSYVVFILTVSVFTIFLLIGRRDIRDRWIRFIGRGNIPGTTKVVDETSRKVGRYLGAQITVNAIFGTALALALTIIGIPQAFLWGGLSILLRFVPFVGGLLSATPPILLSLAVDPTWSTPLATLASFVTIDVAISQFVEPTFIGRQVGVSGFALLLAAAFWTSMWGFTGLVISTPITVCLVHLGRYVSALNFMAILFGDQEVMELPERMYHRLLSNDLNDVHELLRGAMPSGASVTESISQVLDGIAIPTISVARRDFESNRLVISDYKLIARRLSSELSRLTVKEGASKEGDLSELQSKEGQLESQKVRVAVIEADPVDSAMALLIRRIIRMAGYRVVAAPPRHIAFEHRRPQMQGPLKPKVLVVIAANVRDEFKILQRIRAARRFRPTKVVVYTTSHGPSGVASRWCELGGIRIPIIVATDGAALIAHLGEGEHHGETSEPQGAVESAVLSEPLKGLGNLKGDYRPI